MQVVCGIKREFSVDLQRSDATGMAAGRAKTRAVGAVRRFKGRNIVKIARCAVFPATRIRFIAWCAVLSRGAGFFPRGA